MSFFNNNFRNQSNDNFTFRGVPPIPKKFGPPLNICSYPPSQPWLEQNYLPDEQFIKRFEDIVQRKPEKKHSIITEFSIGETLQTFRQIVRNVNEMKSKTLYLESKSDVISDEEWQDHINLLSNKKLLIEQAFLKFDDNTIQMLRNQLAKRNPKRLRQKRLRIKKKNEKAQRLQQWNERSRVIDENLQKIKDEIAKTRQEEDMKVKVDAMLRDVRRKKHDANKYISKLDALIKLRVARQNTAKGRGDQLSENDGSSFNDTIGKLKAVWHLKLLAYESEEKVIREKLKKDSMSEPQQDKEREIQKNIDRWSQALFGQKGALPQRDFQGDLHSFVFVRSQWDSFINSSGTSLPIGWVIPSENKF